ncbi:MAG TPA: deaminase [Actinomycetes bacterium]|jgi:tRNA(Arg) A34 adenosine deaminase TadA|nr:deaminase [Actinomycetes bacterium]
MTELTGRFQAAWHDLDPPARRALELAYESLAGSGLACGAVITDADSHRIAEGRNRAYDPPGGPDALQGTPLAHAEMNAFAAVPTGRELAGCTLLSTQQPCSMCAAAAAFLEVGTVRYLAPDPSALASGQPDNAISVGPAADLWVVTANLLFLLSIASKAGVDHPTVVGNHELEPETTEVVLDMVAEGLVAPAWTMGRSVVEVLPARWGRIVAAAAARAERMG